jgi:hypothetical protein
MDAEMMEALRQDAEKLRALGAGVADPEFFDDEEATDDPPHLGCPSYPLCDVEGFELGCCLQTAPEDLEWYGHR